MCKKTNFSIPQFYRIRIHFVGCWDCDWMDYLLWIFGTWWWKCHIRWTVPKPTNQSRSRKTVRAITNPTRKQNGSEMLINCRMWTTLPAKRTLFSRWVLSCTILKTTKLWSKWWLRAEVQQWGHVTWSPKETSHVMSGDRLLRSSNIMNLSVFFPQPFSFKTESKVSSPREFKKVLWKRDRQWRSRDLWNLYQRTSWVRRKILRKFWVIQTAWKTRNWIRVRREDWCSFQSMIPRLDTVARWGQEGQSSSLAAKAKTQTDGKIPSKSSSSKGEFFWNRRKDSVPKFLQMKVYENRHVIFWHPFRVSYFQVWQRMQIWRQVSIPTRWGWCAAQQKVEEKWCERFSSFFFFGVYTIGFLCLMMFIWEDPFARKEGKSGSNHTVETRRTTSQFSTERSIARRHSESVNFMSAIRAPPSWRRGHETKTLHQERCGCRVGVRLGETCPCKLKKTDKAAFLLSFRSQGNAGANWLRSINAHALQKGFKLGRNGDFAEIQELHNGGDGPVENGKQTWKHMYTFTILISS